MSLLARTLLLAFALLTSGVIQVAAAASEEACCADHEAPPDDPCCPEGIGCACCTVRVTLRAGPAVDAPSASPGAALSFLTAEPVLGPPPAGIFQPPRA